jgi:hypothetical protein
LAWRLSKESLRNGHLHTKRLPPGLPRTGRAMVMAETQKSPESVRPAIHLRGPRVRQDSAACVSLSSNRLVKEHSKDNFTLRRPCSAGYRDDSPPPGSPDVNLVVGRENVAQEGLRSVIARARAHLISTRSPCQHPSQIALGKSPAPIFGH